MNRRTFLKSIVTACGAAVVCPGELLRPETDLEDLRVPSDAGLKRWPKYYAKPTGRTGVTDAQLRELVQMTLKDLPQDCMRISFSGIDYTLCHNSKGEYYSGGYKFNR